MRIQTMGSVPRRAVLEMAMEEAMEGLAMVAEGGLVAAEMAAAALARQPSILAASSQLQTKSARLAPASSV